MALSSNALITVEDVKLYLGMESESILSDSKLEWIESQINKYSSFVENYCGQKFVEQNVTSEVRNGNGRAKFRPLYFPIIQLSVVDSPTDAQKLASVQYRDDVDSAWQDIETDIDNIVINNPLPLRATEQTSYNIELLEKVFPLGKQNVKLSYRAGYSDATAYTEISDVVLEMVVMQWKKSGMGNSWLGVNSTNDSLSGRSMSINLKDMKKEWTATLNRYRVKQ